MRRRQVHQGTRAQGLVQLCVGLVYLLLIKVRAFKPVQPAPAEHSHTDSQLSIAKTK